MSSASPDSTQHSFLPTLMLAAGMLICGIVSAWVGALTGNEHVTCILSAIGMAGGSVFGGYLGTHWHRTRIGHPVSTDTHKVSDGD